MLNDLQEAHNSLSKGEIRKCTLIRRQCWISCPCAFSSKTDAARASRSWMECSGSIDFASNAQKSNSPLMDLPWTVANGDEFELALPKQFKKKLNEDQTKKNFRVWWRIGRDFVILAFCVLEKFSEIGGKRLWFWGIVKSVRS